MRCFKELIPQIVLKNSELSWSCVQELGGDAMSSGVAWEDLGPLKAEARQMKYNKSSWTRSLRAAAAAHDKLRGTTAHDVLRDIGACPFIYHA